MLEVLLMGGLDALHAMRLLVPPAWHGLDSIDSDLRAFYEYYSVHMEPWDGPAGIVLTDGRYAACTLDRNGLRPARFVITRNRVLTIASETGVWDYAPEDVVRKGKLGPGDMIALDLQTGTLLESRDVDAVLKTRHPYKTWLKKGVRYLESDLVDPRLAAEPMDRETLTLYQKMFNVSAEERDEIIRVLAEDESEAVGSMGDDTPMPVLSHKVRSLYDYFRQQFAQVRGHRGVADHGGHPVGRLDLRQTGRVPAPGPVEHVVADEVQQAVDGADGGALEGGEASRQVLGVVGLRRLRGRGPGAGRTGRARGARGARRGRRGRQAPAAAGGGVDVEPVRDAVVVVAARGGHCREVLGGQGEGAQQHVGHCRTAVEAGQVESQYGGAHQAVHNAQSSATGPQPTIHRTGLRLLSAIGVPPDRTTIPRSTLLCACRSRPVSYPA